MTQFFRITVFPFWGYLAVKISGEYLVFFSVLGSISGCSEFHIGAVLCEKMVVGIRRSFGTVSFY